MAELNPPLFLDVNNAYGADELGLPYRDLMGEGVVSAGDLLVSNGGGLTSSTAAGAAWVQGDDNAASQPTYRVRSDSAVALAHAAADPTNPRIDLVIAEVLDAAFSGVSKLWRLRVVTGTPAGAPVAPAAPNNALALAQVRINAASGTITSVTDVRPRAGVAGGKAVLGVLPAARVFHNAAQSIANAVATAVAFNSERYDTDLIHDNVTNNSRLTCKTPGLYAIKAQIAFANAATGFRLIQIRINGTTAICDVSSPAINGDLTYIAAATDYQLIVGDYVEVVAYQTNGAAININANGNYSPEFSIVRLGS